MKWQCTHFPSKLFNLLEYVYLSLIIICLPNHGVKNAKASNKKGWLYFFIFFFSIVLYSRWLAKLKENEIDALPPDNPVWLLSFLPSQQLSDDSSAHHLCKSFHSGSRKRRERWRQITKYKNWGRDDSFRATFISLIWKEISGQKSKAFAYICIWQP